MVAWQSKCGILMIERRKFINKLGLLLTGIQLTLFSNIETKDFRFSILKVVSFDPENSIETCYCFLGWRINNV